MSNNIIIDKIYALLSKLKISGTNKPLSESVESIKEINGKYYVTIECHRQDAQTYQKLSDSANQLLHAEKLDCEIILTNKKQAVAPQAIDKRQKVNGVGKIITIVAGKGGVGKSTIALNLAITFAQSGKRVGLVDADIYGPSLTTLSGISSKPALENNLMVPIIKFGLKMMSVSFLMQPDDALIWRGPMITKMLYQLMHLTQWNFDGKDIDILIVDTPPGTGDIHLSLAENYHVDGSIVISTPQQMAVSDVVRAISMLNKLNIPVLGLIENYSYLLGDNGNKQFIFGKNGNSAKICKKFSIPLLADIPYCVELNEASNTSKPLTYYKLKHTINTIFSNIITNLNL